MTIYQEEMQRKALRYGCTTEYNAESNLLNCSYNGIPLLSVTDKGYLTYKQQDLIDPEMRNAFFRMIDDAEVVREYVRLYESGQQMKPKDVRNSRKFAEYGDVVFAGMYSQKYGFMFCSWRQSDGGRYLVHGNYSPDYLSAKEKFAVRAGLISENKIFTRDEATELFKCAAFARDHCETLTYEQDRSLMFLMEKLQDAYPHLKEDPPSFDEDEGIQLNM